MKKHFKGQKTMKIEPDTKSESHTLSSDLKYSNYLLYLLLIIGVAVRFFSLGSIPFGSQFDEAQAGYDAFAMANYGYDSHGDHNPIYFYGAGNGAYPLYTYLSILPVKIFGFSIFSGRFMMALLGCLSLVFFYIFIKKVTSEKVALLSLFLLVINPWSIMHSRWSIMPNTIVFFALAGCYFLYLGIEKYKFLIIAAVFFGLGMFSYPTAWITFPFIILLELAYCIYCKKISLKDRAFILHVSIAAGIFFLCAIPNVLFLLISKGLIGEIRNNFITIPKLIDVNNVSVFSPNVLTNIISYLRYYIINQTCWTFPNTGSGMFYFFSTPFILIGFAKLTLDFIRKIKVREFYLPVIPLFQIFGSIFIILFAPAGTSYHQNVLYLPAIYCCAYGVYYIWERMGASCGKAIVALYAVAFVIFVHSYWTAPPQFQGGYEGAVAKAQESDASKVYVLDIEHPQFLVASKYPADKLIADSEYYQVQFGDPVKPRYFLRASRIGRYYFQSTDLPLDENAAYIYHVSRAGITDSLSQAGFQIEQLEQFVFAEKK